MSLVEWLVLVLKILHLVLAGTTVVVYSFVLDKSANASSIEFNAPYINLVDEDGSTIFGTLPEPSPWVMVDLGSEFCVQSLTIFQSKF